jgi:MOSC domain-containing protein YiiM
VDDVGIAVDHLSLAALEDGLDEIRRSPADRGLIELIVRRPAIEERELLAEATIDETAGLVGDNWASKPTGPKKDGPPNPGAQLTVMNARVASLVAVDPERRALAGDQLYVDLDLSARNVPPGTRLGVGSALIEVTSVPHRGCGKFTARFGVDAMKFVNSKAGRELNLRGINARVLEGGTVRVGDLAEKLL